MAQGRNHFAKKTAPSASRLGRKHGRVAAPAPRGIGFLRRAAWTRTTAMEIDADTVAVGIDLGSEYCCVAYCKDGRGEIIANEDGERSTPAAVAFDSEERVRSRSAPARVGAAPSPAKDARTHALDRARAHDSLPAPPPRRSSYATAPTPSSTSRRCWARRTRTLPARPSGGRSAPWPGPRARSSCRSSTRSRRSSSRRSRSQASCWSACATRPVVRTRARARTAPLARPCWVPDACRCAAHSFAVPPPRPQRSSVSPSSTPSSPSRRGSRPRKKPPFARRQSTVRARRRARCGRNGPRGLGASYRPEHRSAETEGGGHARSQRVSTSCAS